MYCYDKPEKSVKTFHNKMPYSTYIIHIVSVSLYNVSDGRAAVKLHVLSVVLALCCPLVVPQSLAF